MFTDTAIRDAVADVRDAPVVTVTPVEPGNNHTYRVAFGDGQRAFLKVGTRFSEASAAEPATVRLVDRATPIPVPSVWKTGTEPLGYPFAVYEYVDGAAIDWVGALPEATAADLCREAGEHLAALHDSTFPQFGRLGVAPDASADEVTDTPDSAGPSRLAVVDPRSFEESLGRSLDRQLGELSETPFADRRSALATAGERLLDDIDIGGVDPALVHGDYRLDNLRVDLDAERVTAAVLDWELPTAADPLWDAVMAETLLTTGHRTDPAMGAALRSAFRSGYGGYPDAPARLRLYELLGRIRLARHLDVEMASESASARAARVADHHAAFDRLLAGGSVLRDE
ncbi:phosphotransferase family protein [Halobaculum limi]|uniref:phosphotransferase family protein n=1 Tax=Halobaculum limi TaxID=3031916 RepID=UPI0024052228|nr:phosphotransferase [Halobaculum sp. YSMS11]